MVEFELTFVSGLEEPVAWADPRGHGAGAEVGVFSGLIGQLQAHGGDIRFSYGYNPPVKKTRISLRSKVVKQPNEERCGQNEALVVYIPTVTTTEHRVREINEAV